jgi:hypothetical protein
MEKLIKVADIVFSPDDGGWYASMLHYRAGDIGTIKPGRLSPTFSSKDEAEAWARKRGAATLLYP